jgi:tetratricopeptide (TPR) repeat protein
VTVGLLLQAVEVAGPWRWRWLLLDEDSGEPLADHDVALDPGSSEVAAFAGLYEYLDGYAVPDRRTVSEAQIVAATGAWAGREVLGDAVGAAILAAAPVSVRVAVPAGLGLVLGWPLELAHAEGVPLAARGDVALVYDLSPVAGGGAGWVPGGPVPGVAPGVRVKDPVAGVLRVLAVFSQPDGTSVLALRRERYELTRLIRRIAAHQRLAAQVAVVQYGATRARLAAIAEDGAGWDVLHLSGHGRRGVFVLEHPDGSPDPVSTVELAGLLAPARRRVKLAVVSACESGAATIAETLRLMGLEEQATQLEQHAAGPGGPGGGTPGVADGPAAGTAGPIGAAGGLAAGDPAGSAGGPVPGGTGLGVAGSDGAAAPVVTGLARALGGRLGCPVVAMRYPVTDDFAVAFAGELYQRLLSYGQPVDVAVARAAAAAAGPVASAARPPVSLATPGVFGAQAAGLVLTVPAGQPDLGTGGGPMAYFPAEPDRFVGRGQAMARASAALAPASGVAGVVLHGMAGAGKTACALELAYRHQDSFAAAAFWQAPARSSEFAGALGSLAVALEVQLGQYGFTMADKIATTAALTAWLPRLRRLLEDNGILLVLDNLETLLTADGTWRDPRWAPLATALASHRGESRTIMTSRIPPVTGPANGSAGPGAATGGTAWTGGATTPGGSGMVTLAVHALSRDEAVALARELPRLRALLHADSGPVRDGHASDLITADRALVRRVMHVVQGHPKLLELADAAAADPAQLERQLTTAEDAQRARGGQLEAFFRDGTSALDATQFLHALTGWTTTAMTALPAPAQLLLRMLACLEDTDRQHAIIDANWADLWHRLGQPGDPPDPAPLITALTHAALIRPENPNGGTASDDDTTPGNGTGAGNPRQPTWYRMHPGVAEALRAGTSPEITTAVDTELAAFWQAVAGHALRRDGTEDSGMIVHSGLAAAPYLLRRQDWDAASAILERAISRDESPGTIQVALPSLRRIAEATGAPKDLSVLATALRSVDAAEAEQLLRDSLVQAGAAGDFGSASATAGELANLLRDAGRLTEALDVITQKADFARRAGLGPWTQLADEGRRLQVIALMGDHEEVVAKVRDLRARMDQLPAPGENDRTVYAWNIREATFDLGRSSALALREWQQCLDLNAEILRSKAGRGASAHEIARFRFNDAAPLIRLGRLADAERILLDCQQVYEDHSDINRLAQVLSVRADLEDERGHTQAALSLERTTIRLTYTRPEPRDIAISHHNLATYLAQAGADPAEQRAHRLAAALIYQLTGMNHQLATTLRALAAELRDPGDRPDQLPATLADVIEAAERTEGVHLGRLIAVLQSDPAVAAAAVGQLLRAAAELPAGSPDIARYLRDWEPVIDGVATSAGDPDAAAALAAALTKLDDSPSWAELGRALRAILAGQRGDTLLGGLDPIDTAIAAEVLRRLTAPPADSPAG